MAPADHPSRARAIKALLIEFPAEEIERHFAMMPERYLRATDAARMERHFRLLRSLGDEPAAVEWRDLDDGQCTELTVAARVDRPGLFAALAGTLTAQGVNILGVDLFTREDGRVLDTFRVSEQSGNRPIREEKRPRIEASVIEAVAGRLEVENAVDRWRSRTTRPLAAQLGARGPGTGRPLRQRVVRGRHRGRGAGPGPARPRLHHRATRSPSSASTSRSRRSRPQRPWPWTCST